MKSSNQLIKGLYRKGQTPYQIIKKLIRRRIEIEEKNHQTIDRLAQLRADTDKLLHPERYQEKQ
ncbi:hypothetical protein [Pedobacter sp. ASV28]|jgi:uncharacterized protein YutE (UPF0331/DUF86 family)|uniref:hypothetical protein n=1 Tax=Pedobacter sp. ASV28 TaxID=2795123 RepID=UPI0018EE2F38|nr:hypothetical protein [Pedobacter sp. ASV28]